MPPTTSPAAEARTPVAFFGVALLLLGSTLSLVPSGHREALPVLIVLAAGSVLAYRTPSGDRLWPYAGAVLAAGAVPWTGGADSPLLAYLLAPALALGLSAGPRRLILGAVTSAGAMLLSSVVPGVADRSEIAAAGAQWVLLSLALGLVAAWAQQPSLHAPPPGEYAQVRILLEQLRSLTRDLPNGLDAPSTADVLLQDCGRSVPHARSAVIVQPAGGAFVPLAVLGARRVPWRAPLDKDGPLRTAWESGRPVLDRRTSDLVGRRQGSALIALPLLSSGVPFGLVILEAFDPDSFDAAALDRIQRIVDAAAPRLETALLFEELRMVASTEERNRLAREMHDGIAQELAFVGYRLDELRGRAAALDPDLAESVGALRGELTGIVSDLRLSITDLRTTVRSDRGLGAVLGSYLQSVCTGTPIILHLSLQETAFRLPAEQEIALLQAARVFAQEARHSRGVRTLSVVLVVDPPSARLELRADGPSRTVYLGGAAAVLERAGATVISSPGPEGGTVLHVALEGGFRDDQRAAGGRSRLDQTGPAASLRTD